MPATIPTIEPEVLAAFRAGDEAALERVYRERYRVLLDAATRELGDVSRAARVVERVAADAWKARSELETPSAFERSFAALLHGRIVREQARVASLHRHASAAATAPHGAAPSADVSWEHMKALLHPAMSASELSAMQRESRRHTAEHLAAVGRRRTPVRSIVLIVAAALATAGLVLVVPLLRRDDVGKALDSPDARTVASRPGQRGMVRLGDGTQAVLGADSRIIIPPGFGSQLRALELQGTASFTVAANEKPFIVRADRATVTALGTTFDMSAFSGDRLLAVRVRQGEVELKTRKGTRLVKQGEAVSVASSGAMHSATGTEMAETLGWVDGELQIIDRPLREALPIIRRWFDIDLRATEEQLLDRRLTLRVGLDSSRAAIRVLQKDARVVLLYERNTAVLHDVAPAAKKE